MNSNLHLNTVLAVMLSVGCISMIEPSPYDFLFIALAFVTILSGITITRVTLLFSVIIAFFLVSLGLSLMPYVVHRVVEEVMTPLVYSIISMYMFIMALVFALIFSKDTSARLDVALKAYAFSCTVTGIWDFLSYFDIGGLAARERIAGRVAGPFKDPNVSGSYCVLGALYFLQRLIMGPPRYRLLNGAGFVLATSAVFLSYSRGSWLALIISAAFMFCAIYITAENERLKRKVLTGVSLILFVTIMLGLILASNETIRDTIATRFQVVQDYDAGSGGRFSNQLNSIALLIQRPLGFGPFRFPLFFPYQPHNSYIGAFAAAGWMGGIVFLFLMLLTGKIAFGLCFKRTPFLRDSQIVCAAFLTVLLQAIQIDMDHWRFAFLMMGMVWGLESARLSLPRCPSTRIGGSSSDARRLLANEVS